MSIFDVIKYPISTSFNLKDLEALPPDVLSRWWLNDILNDNTNTSQISAQNIIPWIAHTDIGFRTRALALLKARLETL